MSLVPNKALEGASGNQGYNLQRSLRFRSSASAYLNRTQSAGNQTTWTFSAWVKLGQTGGSYILHAGASSGSGLYYDASAEELQVEIGNGTTQYYARTSASFRDFSAWYHVLCVADTSNSTSANRLQIYVNGVLQTIGVSSYPTSSFAGTMCQNATATNIGKFGGGSSAYFDGYLAEVNFIDGQALTPSSFGQTDSTTGAWIPKRYGGSYGTNGFYLNFSDNTSATTLAYDKSGNGNNWTPNNISTTAGATYDSMTDVPTLTSASAANFATLNPLNVETGMTGTLSAANLTVGGSGGKRSTISVTTGKWYWEFVSNSGASANFPMSGLYVVGAGTYWPGYDGNSFGYFQGGAIYYNGSTSLTVSSYTDGDIIGFAYDADSGKVWVSKNGTWQNSGNPSAGTGQVYTLPTGIERVVGAYSSSGTSSINFGQRPFSYTPPTGFKALNTFNLPDPTIKKPNQYMDATLYTGNGGLQSLTNSGSFQPDLVWIKSRSAAQNNGLYDSVRGAGICLRSNQTTSDNNFYPYGVQSFNSNGFTVSDGAASPYDVNGSTGSPTYVGWQWKESATAGFDIVTYTGNGSNNNIPHNLGVAPKMIVTKSRSGTTDWVVYHASVGTGKYLVLNGTGATTTDANYYTAMASNSWSCTGSATAMNTNGATYVAYAFAEIAGFSKFGSYVGNSYSGGTDGTFVYLGFKPKYVMVKMTSSSGYDWVIYDSARNTTNVVQNYLLADQSYSENAGGLVADIDFVSNGFKLRNSGSSSQSTNIGNQTYIYAAFAENPFKYSNAR